MNTYVESQLGSPTLLEAPPLDLQFGLAQPYEGFNPPSVRNAELEPVVETFARNIERLQNLLAFPSFAVWVSRALERHGNTARAELPPDASEEQFRLTRNLHWKKESERTPASQMVDFSLRGITELIEAMDTHVWLGLEAILLAQITGMWTAFEYLAGDLWKGAVNAYPKTARPLIKKQFKFTDTLFEHVTGGSYDLHAGLGTFLADSDAVTFDSLKSLKESYSIIHSDVIKKKILPDPAIGALSLVRNVIAHKAGIADDEYLRRHRAVGAPFRKLNRKLPITGKAVHELIAPVLAKAIELIDATDKWITTKRGKDEQKKKRKRPEP
ncbi:MAG: hypothetical protein AB7U73_00565 [Pirellulales bacterium]